MQMSDSAGTQIPPLKKRHIYYVTGFDPRGISFYYSLLKREALLSKKRKQSQFYIGKLNAEDEHSSSCELIFEAPENFTAEYHLLSILDLITAYFRQSIAKSIWQALTMLWMMFSSKTILKCLKHSFKFGLFILYPFTILLLMTATSWGISTILSTQLLAPAYSWACIPIFLLFFYLFLLLLKKTDQLHYIFYLLGDFYFSQTAVRNKSHELNLRIDLFAKEIAKALKKIDENEEILIVGHSSGGLLAIQLAAKLCTIAPAETLSRLSLLTMGNQASLGFLNGAEVFHKNIDSLLENPNITWRDVFAPQDVISSGKFDLTKFFSGRPSSGYECMSARLRESLTPENYKKIVHKFFTVHMQYLRSSETGRGFDYFQLLNSPMRLKDYKPK